MYTLNSLSTIIADTVFIDDVLVAKDVSITLPEIRYMTTELNAMGSMSIPLAGLIENMELTITRVGFDLELCKAIVPAKLEIECRWIQEYWDPENNRKTETWKAHMTGVPQSMPSMGVNSGEQSISELKFSLFSYVLQKDGANVVKIDRTNRIIEIDGESYYPENDIAEPAGGSPAE